MRVCLLYNEIAMDFRDSMRQRDDAPAASARFKVRKCAFDLCAVVNTASGYFNFEAPGRILYCSKKFLMCGRFRMHQDQHTSDGRRSFPEHLKPLAAHRSLEIGKPGYVATGSRQVFNEAAS